MVSSSLLFEQDPRAQLCCLTLDGAATAGAAIAELIVVLGAVLNFPDCRALRATNWRTVAAVIEQCFCIVPFDSDVIYAERWGASFCPLWGNEGVRGEAHMNLRLLG